MTVRRICSRIARRMGGRICRVRVGHVSFDIMPLIEPDDAHTPPTVECPASSYVLSFQAETFHQHKRYHWMICGAQNPDELVSWGHSPTQELAAVAARDEVNDLSSGLSQGGQMTSPTHTFSHRRTFHR